MQENPSVTHTSSAKRENRNPAKESVKKQVHHRFFKVTSKSERHCGTSQGCPGAGSGSGRRDESPSVSALKVGWYTAKRRTWQGLKQQQGKRELIQTNTNQYIYKVLQTSCPCFCHEGTFTFPMTLSAAVVLDVNQSWT